MILASPLLIKKGAIRFPGIRDQYLPPDTQQVGLAPVTPSSVLPTIQVANTEASLIRNEQLNNYNNIGTSIIFGKNNQIANGFKGIIIGDNKSISSEPGVYVGDFALTKDGLVRVQNIIGITGIIDGGEDIVLPYSKTNEADLIDASENAVRKFGGGVAGGFIIDGRDTLPPLNLI
jgi:hypothetical protein